MRSFDIRARTLVGVATALALQVLCIRDSAAQDVEVSLFSISKSENRNTVRYAARVSERCVPVSESPIWAYWRMLALGPARTEPLLARELPAYGLAEQSVLERAGEGGTIRLVLRALHSRPVSVRVWRGENGVCEASSTMTIAGEPARLFDVYVKLGWPARVEYLLLRGWSADGTRVVTEKING
jgi:hypothetical protein